MYLWAILSQVDISLEEGGYFDQPHAIYNLHIYFDEEIEDLSLLDEEVYAGCIWVNPPDAGS